MRTSMSRFGSSFASLATLSIAVVLTCSIISAFRTFYKGFISYLRLLTLKTPYIKYRATYVKFFVCSLSTTHLISIFFLHTENLKSLFYNFRHIWESLMHTAHPPKFNKFKRISILGLNAQIVEHNNIL